MLALIVQALEPGTARSVVGVLVKALPPGSYLVATVGAGDAGRLPDSVWPAAATEADLAAFFGGLDLLPPGISQARRRALRRRRQAVPRAGPVDEIAPGVFVATADMYTTTTTVVAGADGGCLLIDPAVTVADLAALAGWLSERGLRPVGGLVHPPALGSSALVGRVRRGAQVRDAARGRGRRQGAARARQRRGGVGPGARPDALRPGRAAARPRDRLGRAAGRRLRARRARARAWRGAAARGGRADRRRHALGHRDPAARPGVGRPVRRLPAGTGPPRGRAGRAPGGARPRPRRRPGRVPPAGRRRPRLPGRDRGRRGPRRRTPRPPDWLRAEHARHCERARARRP